MRALTLSVLFVAGCAEPQPEEMETLAEPPTSLMTSLDCEPRSLSDSDVLTLSMGTPHGGDLAVISPDGTFYFLVLDGVSPADAVALSDEFSTLDRLRISVAEAVALPHVYGRTDAERFFREGGEYTFRLSANLETDDGTPMAECSVRYEPGNGSAT